MLQLRGIAITRSQQIFEAIPKYQDKVVRANLVSEFARKLCWVEGGIYER